MAAVVEGRARRLRLEVQAAAVALVNQPHAMVVITGRGVV
jgi:hypothetical protein